MEPLHLIDHIKLGSYLQEMVSIGCHFLLDDLDPYEWAALRGYNRGKNKFEYERHKEIERKNKKK